MAKNAIQKVEPTEPPQSPIERMATLVAHPDSKIDAAGMATLLDAQLKYEANEARKAYAAAMAAFKEDPPQIIKDRTVGYQAKGGTVGYSHASLGNVTLCINKALSAHGLTASWETGQVDGKVRVTCHITHVLGHRESTFLDAAPDGSGSKNPIQAIGSTVTYLQRYTLLALTGLATYEQDDDGNGAGKQAIDIPKPNQQQLSVISAICCKITPPSGKRVDTKKATAIFWEQCQKYPADMNYVESLSTWIVGLNRPELFIPDNRSDFEKEQGLPGDEDSVPDTEAEETAAAKFGKENEEVELRYYCTKCDKEFEEFKIKGVCVNTDCLSRDIIDRQAN